VLALVLFQLVGVEGFAEFRVETSTHLVARDIGPAEVVERERVDDVEA
jgi:hypothetical protein